MQRGRGKQLKAGDRVIKNALTKSPGEQLYQSRYRDFQVDKMISSEVSNRF